MSADRAGGQATGRQILAELLNVDAGIVPASVLELAEHFELGEVRSVSALTGGANASNALLVTGSGSWVLRVAADDETGDHQLRREGYFAEAIHRTTSIEAPWPYRVDLTRDLLPAPFSFMPYLRGQPIHWREERAWSAVGEALAGAAIALRAAEWRDPGPWDASAGEVVPDGRGPAARWRARADALRARLVDAGAPLDASGEARIEQAVADLEGMSGDTRQCLVHGDLVIGNVTFAPGDGPYRVAGVFDLETARISDPDEDLVRHLWWSCFAQRPEAATGFLRRCTSEVGVGDRLLPYCAIDLLDVWTYGQVNAASWFGRGATFDGWAGPLHDAVSAIVASVT